MTTALLPLLPSLVVVGTVLGLGASGLQAASAALATTLLLWLAGTFSVPDAAHLVHAGLDGGILATLVAAMIVPGVLFVEATRRLKSEAAMGALVDALRLGVPVKSMLIACGLGVLVESLTGMGVSLLVTVPLLLRLLDRRAAIGVALVGMSLMPWGALSISAHVGAKLAALGMDEFALAITRTSGPVAFFLPLLCLLFQARVSRSDIAAAVAIGIALVAGIAAGSRFLGIEVAGVSGGLAVIAAVSLTVERKPEFWCALTSAGLRPYFVLIAAVALQKALVGPLESLGISPALASPRVRFALLTSPGVALLVATLVMTRARIDRDTFARVATRAWRPVASVALFMVSARLLVEMGGIERLAALLGGLGPLAAVVATAGIGAIGGFATGSGVTSNALFMPSAAATGRLIGDVPLYAAVQNGAGGHVGIASLPVAAILLTALGGRQAGDDRVAMRLGLRLSAWHLLVLSAAAAVGVWRLLS